MIWSVQISKQRASHFQRHISFTLAIRAVAIEHSIPESSPGFLRWCLAMVSALI